MNAWAVVLGFNRAKCLLILAQKGDKGNFHLEHSDAVVKSCLHGICSDQWVPSPCLGHHC